MYGRVVYVLDLTACRLSVAITPISGPQRQATTSGHQAHGDIPSRPFARLVRAARPLLTNYRDTDQVRQLHSEASVVCSAAMAEWYLLFLRIDRFLMGSDWRVEFLRTPEIIVLNEPAGPFLQSMPRATFDAALAFDPLGRYCIGRRRDIVCACSYLVRPNVYLFVFPLFMCSLSYFRVPFLFFRSCHQTVTINFEIHSTFSKETNLK